MERGGESWDTEWEGELDRVRGWAEEGGDLWERDGVAEGEQVSEREGEWEVV